jgi:predicted dehydrogenase
VSRPDVDAVIVSTINEALAPLTEVAVSAGTHVLVEKPGARTGAEIERLAQLSARNDVHVQVGFNHRFHPSFLAARRIVDAGELGPILYVRGRYGHGGRLGYDREWRSDPALSGGGELLDQGVHLIDLSRWFLGDFSAVDGFIRTYFWDMPVEDNGFLALRTDDGQIAWLHASCTEWKNTFSFEIFGKLGKLQIDGLGGSYGVERLTHYRMLPEMGPPETTIWEYPGEDRSWHREFEAFVESIGGMPGHAASLDDASAALRAVSQVYEHATASAGGIV